MNYDKTNIQLSRLIHYSIETVRERLSSPISNRHGLAANWKI